MQMNRILNRMVFLLAVVAIFACQQPAEEKAAQGITEAALIEHLTFLSHDSLEGGPPATRGSDIGMQYIADRYKQ